MTKYIFKYITTFLIFFIMLNAQELTQQERNTLAAKLVPIYMLLLDDTPLHNTPTTAKTGIPFEMKSTPFATLSGAPEGMTINPKTGLITWTPTPNQVGDIDFDVVKDDGTIDTITLKVKTGNLNLKNAIFVSPNGDNNNEQSADSPLANLQKLCSPGTVLDGKTIYLRGGVYNNFPMIRCSGTPNHILEIKPWGNENAKFTFDGAVGLRLDGNYIHLSGIEVEGVAQKINFDDAVANWWRGDRYYNGTGIVAAGHHIEINDCVVHDTPGSGISGTKGDYFNIHDNIVYNGDWWTIAGSKGIGVTDAVASDSKGYIKIENNLIFNVESRIYSRVWNKGFAHLDLDEGEGIIVQVNDGNYTGRYTIRNNFLLFDGKGIVVNKTNRADVLNNTLYKTGTTISGNFKGVRMSLTQDSTIKNNAIELVGDGYSINIGKSQDAEVKRVGNCGNGSESLTGITIKNNIFPNAKNLDFTPVSGCSGADLNVWKRLKAKAQKLGIEIKPTNWVVDHKALTKGVIDSIPKDATVDWSSWNNSQEFNLTITNIPDEGIKGRPDSFRLEVVHPYPFDKTDVNLAHIFGVATQGTREDSNYRWYYPASNAIDGNLSTFNHTRDRDENWLQIALPKGLKISKIVVIGRDGNTAGRLADAKVVVQNSPYSGSINEANVVATLKGIADAQEIKFDTPKLANYVIVKAKDGSNLHLRELEVYGTFDDKPYFSKSNFEFGVPFNAEAGYRVAKIDAIKNGAKTLNYEIIGSSDFAIDSSGVLTLKKALDYNRQANYKFKVKVSDEKGESNIANINVTLLAKNGVVVKRWDNIEGSVVRDLLNSEHFKDKPDSTRVMDSIDYHAQSSDNFGEEFNTVLKADKSGDYIFAIIGDDGTRLDLDGKTIILRNNWGDYRDWANASKSLPIYLKEGEIHTIKAYLKEGGGAEGISVGYKMVGDDEFTPLPAQNLFVEALNSQNIKPQFNSDVSTLTLAKNKNTVGDKILDLSAFDSQGDNLTYTILGDVPFGIDENGMLYVNGSLEAKDYGFDVEVSDGVNSTIKHITITSTVNTKDLNEEKEAFLSKARAFTKDSSVDDLVQSFVDYAYKKSKNDYDLYLDEPVNKSTWEFINNNASIKEGLYASKFPINPYYIKNLNDFLVKWKEDGKSDAFIQKYKNVALGLAINARERGIFDEAIFGDTAEHKTVNYLDLPKYRAKIERWREHLDFKNLGYNLSKSQLRYAMEYIYKLSVSEADDMEYYTSRLKAAIDDGYTIDTITPEVRKTYNISFDLLNVYRVVNGLERADCSAEGNPCAKIEAYIDSENNATITKTYILAHFTDFKDKMGLIAPNKNMTYELRGLLGLVPNEVNEYRLMSFYDLANWKITNNEIPAKDFNDNEPNWPLFDYNLTKLPWQILALEQSAQKQECKYVKSRFFETDKAKLRESYPPHAVNPNAAEKRFIEYTTYTWDYDRPEVWYRKSDWTPHRTVYRILQDGGVCGRQSTMGQHVNECLNRPSIGTGQPGHRAWVGVYFNKDIPGQLQTNIGYQVGSRESATPKIYSFFNPASKGIRDISLERFTGVVTGVSSKPNGEHIYNQSMILQHIANILEEEGSSAEAVLKKAVEIMPQNVDAWYQLAMYYAKLDKPQKIIALAKEYMDKRNSFFMEPDDRKGAENLEVVTGKNIAFAINFAPSIDFGKGENAEWGMQALWDYLDTYEKDYRSVRSYRNQNRYLANYYLSKEHDENAFSDAVAELFERFLNNSHTEQYSEYFRGVNFADCNKTALFDRLQNITDSAQINKGVRIEVYTKILGRNFKPSLTDINVNDICLDNNLSKCQSVQEFTLDAKAIYMIAADDHVFETAEVKPSDRGKEGYSTLIIPATDSNGTDIDLKVRIAKVLDSGKMLKINDPTPVDGDKTKYRIWIDSGDNNLEDKKVYTANQRIVLQAKKRVENNEENMGNVIINLKDLIKGHKVTVNSDDFDVAQYDDKSTSIYFVALKSDVGPTVGVWWKNGHSTVSIPVVDDDGKKNIMKFRATNDGYKMNSGLSADWGNTLKLVYNAEDNPNLKSNTHYKSISAVAIDARMWHKGDKITDRLYIGVDFTTP